MVKKPPLEPMVGPMVGPSLNMPVSSLESILGPGLEAGMEWWVFQKNPHQPCQVEG
jgi:hypothetical protein